MGRSSGRSSGRGFSSGERTLAQARLPAATRVGYEVIDRSGQWWTGTAFGDLAEFLREFTAQRYPSGPV
jgi:hypothetical protein